MATDSGKTSGPEAEFVGAAREYAAEAERTLDSYARRFGLADARASVLAGASAVAISVTGTQSPNAWLCWSVIAGALASILGVLGLLAWRSTALNWISLRDEVLVKPEARMLVWVADKKLDVAAKNEGRLVWKLWALNIGFILLAVSVILAAIGILVS